MIRKFLFALMSLMFMLNMAFAAVDANTASKEDLDKVKGIGPAIAQKIVDERQKNGPFKSLDDLQKRVAGVGEKSVQKMATAGLTVGGGSGTAASDDKTAKASAKASAKEAKAAKAAAKSDDAASAAGDKKPRKSKKDAAASAAKP